MSRPIIGITCDYDYEKKNTRLYKGYHEGVLRAGGLPFLLPITKDRDLDISEILTPLDGIMFTGGQDIDPAYFGETPLPRIEDISPYRDELEIPLCQEAINRDMPVFGICRGIQLMNVAMGGTVYQDIESQLGRENLQKHSQQAPDWYGSHGVDLLKDTKIRGIMRTHNLRVNSYHHQSIKKVADIFIISGKCQDGIIESIEAPTHKFVLGVQWHPERMWEREPLMLNLFKSFIEASRS